MYVSLARQKKLYQPNKNDLNFLMGPHTEMKTDKWDHKTVLRSFQFELALSGNMVQDAKTIFKKEKNLPGSTMRPSFPLQGTHMYFG